MHAPTNAHYQMVKRILRYVKGTLSLGVRILRESNLDLYAFSDADWAGCPTTQRSTTGFCTFLGSNCISWSAKKQPTISRSSTEAEYRAMASTAAELTWVSFILRDIGVSQAQPPFYFMIISLLSTCLSIRFYMLELSTLPLTITLFMKKLLLALFLPDLFLLPCKLQICSPSRCHVLCLMVLKPNLAFGTLPRQV